MNNIFGGGDGSSDPTGGSDLGTMLSSIGQAFTSGGTGGGTSPTSSPVATVNAVQQATDPTGTVAATNAITGGQAPQQTQSQSPQGPNQGGQNQNQDQFAPPNAVEALKKALQGLRQQQRQNPYSFPGGAGSAEAGQNSPILNRAGRIPTDAVPNKPAEPDDPNAPSQYASNTEFMNDNTPPPPPSGIDPADAVRAGLRRYTPDTSGQFQMPGPANENAPSENFPAFLKNLREGGGAAPEAPAQTATSAPPTLDLGQNADGGGLGGLAALARMMGLGPAGLGAAIAMKPTPAETGELTPGQVGMSYRPEDDPQAPKAPAYRPEDDPRAQPPSAGPVTKAPKTGKPIKTVDPKTNKPVDPKTGAPLPTHKGPLPTKTGEYQPATGNARDKVWRPDTPTGYEKEAGPIMRDISGVSTGVPQQLGDLAKMAMPLLMMALGGMGGGGGGRHHGRGFGGFGHPGGRGMWPYHHPNFGWGMHGFHPGGGWRPMHPVHFRQMGGGGPLGYAGGGQGGMTGNPAVDAILQQMSGGRQGGGGQQGEDGGGGGGDEQPWTAPEGGNAGTPLTDNRTIGAADDVLATIRQRESDGQNKRPQENYAYPRSQASGYYQIQPGTWRAWARDSGDTEAANYREAYLAPQAVQDRMARWALQKYGPNASYTWAASGPYPNVDPKSWQTATAENTPKPGTTPTGGTKTPNPEGNPATTQMGPESVAAQ